MSAGSQVAQVSLHVSSIPQSLSINGYLYPPHIIIILSLPSLPVSGGSWVVVVGGHVQIVHVQIVHVQIVHDVHVACYVVAVVVESDVVGRYDGDVVADHDVSVEPVVVWDLGLHPMEGQVSGREDWGSYDLHPVGSTQSYASK